MNEQKTIVNVAIASSRGRIARMANILAKRSHRTMELSSFSARSQRYILRTITVHCTFPKFTMPDTRTQTRSDIKSDTSPRPPRLESLRNPWPPKSLAADLIRLDFYLVWVTV